VPIDKFKENLTKIITHPSITSHKPKILLATPPPLDEIRLTELDLEAGHPGATRLAKVSASYAETVRHVAAENPGVVLVDLWRALMDTAIAKTPGFDPKGSMLGDPESGRRGHLEHLLPDGLHMSGESYRVFYDIVLPHIGPEWPNVPAAYMLPDWKVAPRLDE
jgi:hypothetical protein